MTAHAGASSRATRAQERPRLTAARLASIDRALACSSGVIADLVREIRLCWLDIARLKGDAHE